MDYAMKKNLFCFVSLTFIGCIDTVGSSELSTSEMIADISIVVVDSQIQTQMTLKKDAWTYVKLEEGDRIEISNGFEMKESYDYDPSGPRHRYVESFAHVDAGTEFSVSLLRESDDSALDSIAEIPEDFILTAPQTDTRHSRAEDLYIQWEEIESEDSMHINIDGVCIVPQTYEIDIREGEFTIPASDILLADLFEVEKEEDGVTDCWVMLTTERRRSGRLDSKFGSGDIFGGYRQELELFLVP
jgi:hypothetical protein